VFAQERVAAWDQTVTREPVEDVSAGLDEATLRAVAEWRRAWLREWERVRQFPLCDEDLPAPLWCWPP